MNITIRQASAEDTPLVAWTVLTALDLKEEDFDMQLFHTMCGNAETMYSWRNSFIAEVDGVAVGCLIAYEGRRYLELRDRTWPQLWGNIDPDYLARIEPEALAGEFYLDSMAIQPHSRGLGIGHRLMQAAMTRGRALGCQWATLIVDVHKPRLHDYYQRIGFEDYGQMEFFGHDYHRMRVSL